MATGVFFAVLLEFMVRIAPVPDLTRFDDQSQVVVDAGGELLWAFLSRDDSWRLSSTPYDASDDYLRLLLAYEDKRFYHHNGVDPFAIARAAWQALRHREVVSGASTLTMQAVRLLEPTPRNLGGKIRQALGAIKLERVFSKDEILSIYMTLAPFGGNIEGVRAASLIYFNKEPNLLTQHEAALLVALPRSPERLRPDRHPAEARMAINAVLARLAGSGSEGEWTAEEFRPLEFSLRDGLVRNAPHLAMRLRRATSDHPEIRTTIDLRLQREAETIIRDALANTVDGVGIAAIIARLDDMSVVAYIGGGDFFDAERSGQVDLVQAIRSPGSALKPFIYGMAFERLLVHPDTIVVDKPFDFGGYEPSNFDGGFAGDLKIRTALIHSVNTIAVALMDAIGPSRFVSRLRSAGVPLNIPNSDEEAGLAIALGGAGISLADLTRLYAALGHQGRVRPLRYRPTDPKEQGAALISPRAARAVTDILADIQPPPGQARRTALDGGRRLAFKTGTSYGFRDAWAIGYDQTHVVGVWLGRPDGAPHRGSYGITAAAPILLKLFDLLPVPKQDVAQNNTPLGPLVSPRRLPRRLARWLPRGDYGAMSIRLPRNDSLIALEATDDGAIPIAVAGGYPPYRIYIDGVFLELLDEPETRWVPPGSGQFELLVIDQLGHAAHSAFWLE